MPVYELPEMYAPEFKELDSFTQGYIQAMFFTNHSQIPMTEFHTEESQEMISEGEADGDLPYDAGFLDIEPESLALIIADCKAFQADNADLLALADACEGYDMERAGMDYWYTRCGHGVGYWDREELETKGLHESFGSPRVGDPRWSEYHDAKENDLGERLSEAARQMGERWVSFGDPDPDSPTGCGYVYIS